MATLFDFVESADKEQLLTHLEEGECDLNARSKHGRTPLGLAALLGREEVVRVLLEKGAEVNLANSSGMLAGWHICNTLANAAKDFVPMYTPHHHYTHTHTHTVGYSALHHGAAWGRVGCLRALVASGANHHLSTRHKETPRDLAERYSKTTCVEYLDCVGTQDTHECSIHCGSDVTSLKSNNACSMSNYEVLLEISILCLCECRGPVPAVPGCEECTGHSHRQ